MSSQIRFKFKNARDSDVVVFEGVCMHLDALKKAIMEKKGPSLAAARVDLIVQDAQTLQEYGPGSTVPKNAAVIVKIKPPPSQRMVAAPSVAQAHAGMTHVEDAAGAAPSAPESVGMPATQGVVSDDQATRQTGSQVGVPDLVAADGAHPRFAGSGRAAAEVAAAATGLAAPSMLAPAETVDPSYVCFSCGARGLHLKKNCPGAVRVDPTDATSIRMIARPGTGLPTGKIVTMEDAAAAAQSGGVVTYSSSGEALGVWMPLQSAFAERAMRAGAASSAAEAAIESGSLPEALVCPICNKLLSEAVRVACCGKVVCDSCGRNAILASPDLSCPLCHNASSPDNFEVAREHRQAVVEFQRTGVFNPSMLSPTTAPAVFDSSTTADAPARIAQPETAGPGSTAPALAQPAPLALPLPTGTGTGMPGLASTEGPQASSAQAGATKPISLTSGPRIKMASAPRPAGGMPFTGPAGVGHGGAPLPPGVVMGMPPVKERGPPSHAGWDGEDRRRDGRGPRGGGGARGGPGGGRERRRDGRGGRGGRGDRPEAHDFESGPPAGWRPPPREPGAAAPGPYVPDWQREEAARQTREQSHRSPQRDAPGPDSDRRPALQPAMMDARHERRSRSPARAPSPPRAPWREGDREEMRDVRPRRDEAEGDGSREHVHGGRARDRRDERDNRGERDRREHGRRDERLDPELAGRLMTREEWMRKNEHAAGPPADAHRVDDVRNGRQGEARRHPREERDTPVVRNDGGRAREGDERDSRDARVEPRAHPAAPRDRDRRDERDDRRGRGVRAEDEAAAAGKRRRSASPHDEHGDARRTRDRGGRGDEGRGRKEPKRAERQVVITRGEDSGGGRGSDRWQLEHRY